ncbi:MAG: hypothetical protein JSV16_01010 [Candidatus Hydrogenedentota bacterium]|nr:MAG: hypothetical protein JSV16_01010 [Candidatus Hydrogenedentota bacterium]
MKGVFFVRKVARFSGDRLFGPERTSTGHPAEIIFKDGELLEGYMVGETAEWSKRFYMIPRERGEVALVLVERSAVQNVFMREEFEKPSFGLRRVLRGLTGRI